MTDKEKIKRMLQKSLHTGPGAGELVLDGIGDGAFWVLQATGSVTTTQTCSGGVRGVRAETVRQ